MVADNNDWPYERGRVPGRFSDVNFAPIKDPQGTDLLSKTTPAKEIQIKGDHYKKYKIQPYEYNQRNKLPYCEGNVVKYVTRHRDKGKKDDILKAIHYLQLILEEEYGDVK
jgi:hypothetical protein